MEQEECVMRRAKYKVCILNTTIYYEIVSQYLLSIIYLVQNIVLVIA